MPKPKFPGPVPQDALDYFAAKQLKPGFDYRDIWREEHALNFTVAKMAELDLLGDVQASLAAALKDGQTFRDWAKRLTPELQKRGWWGIKERVDPLTGEKRLVQLGSPRRLKTIYDANLRTARAAGQWQRIQRTQDTHPYLLYQLGPSEHHRPEHVAWNGLLLPVAHPFWATHMPINGWGCKCWVRQVSRREYDRLKEEGFQDPLAPQELDPDTGLPTGRRITQKRPVQTKAPKIRYRKWVNKRTGEIERVPVGIDPGWDTNPGINRAAALRGELDAKLAAAPEPIAAAVEATGPARYTAAEADDILTALDPATRDVPSIGADRFPEIDPALLRAVTVYTDGAAFWRPVNRALRAGDAGPAIEQYRDLLNNVLSRLPPHAGLVARSMDLDGDELTGFLDAHRRALETGEAIVYPGFTSTTDGPDIWAGNVLYQIASHGGRAVSALSNEPEEREILFRAGTRFKVRRIEQQGATWYIELEDIP